MSQLKNSEIPRKFLVRGRTTIVSVSRITEGRCE